MFKSSILTICLLSKLIAPTYLSQKTADLYKQIRIPLNIETGVPFSKDHEGEYYIEGFDIDELGNLYFLGGSVATLSVFSGNKNIIHKKYVQYTPGQMHVKNDLLYFFESKNNKNNLIILNKRNGVQIKTYKKILDKGFDSYRFLDSTILFSYLDNSLAPQEGGSEYSLSGELIKKKNNLLNLIEANKGFEFLGGWNSNFVFGKFDSDIKKYNLYLKNVDGKLIASASIVLKDIGKSFCGDYDCAPQEHRKLKNGVLYMLNRDKTDAIVSIFQLEKVFETK